MQTRQTRFLPKALAVEVRRLPWRLRGLLLLALAVAGWLALASWSYMDPSLNYANGAQPHNWLGHRGASFAGIMMEWFGLASPFLVLPLAAFGVQIVTGYPPRHLRLRLVLWAAALFLTPALFGCLPVPDGTLLPRGLGGSVGHFAASLVGKLAGTVPALLLWPVFALLFAAAASLCVWRASGLSVGDLLLAFHGMDTKEDISEEEFAGPEPLLHKFTSWVKRVSPKNRAVVTQGPREFWMNGTKAEPSLTPAPALKPKKKDVAPAPKPQPKDIAPVQTRSVAAAQAKPAPAPAPAISAAEDLAAFQSNSRRERGPEGGGAKAAGETIHDDLRIEPFFGPGPRPPAPPENDGGEDDGDGEGPGFVSPFLRLTGKAAKAANSGAQRIAESVANGIKSRKPLIFRKELRAEFDGASEEQDEPEEFAESLPPLSLLARPADSRPRDAAEPALMERAGALMSVLADFGVKGRISGIYPGPVITLFELEPARGTKSSRVVGLADDIARSMSAVSARIAVVPGRDAIGIELPNPKREVVSLRAILELPAFQNSQAALPLALGKSIGGEPIAVDLARMPHLLIAGTTGSGKSVGINAMILSLLYRLPASQCNFIMIDPKMLELSAYDGIPHLLAPVVTDPKKAVAALKWAVKEMNSRYERMSRLGVRNVASYNARAAAAQLRGQPLRRTVQTGFDPVTGEPLVEEETIDAAAMPYLVIVIDEMADLMMCAGKEVEFCVQRLSQMARAAGIHLIMATQRPSVDVVTGTIKANFPSRVSFQVTSKIDSRTIIGEQGAEQLLGAGDMLYMSTGGRIIRAHGPFVSDDEVEAVAQHLKAQGFRLIARTFWRRTAASRRTAARREAAPAASGTFTIRRSRSS